MTVNVETSTTDPLATDGATTEFPFAFPVDDEDDLVVTRTITATGAVSVLTKGTEYTVSLADPGGTVTTVATYSSGSTLVISRDTERTQDRPIGGQTNFLPEELEAGLDKLTMMVQELHDRLAAIEAVTDLIDPSGATGGQFLRFDGQRFVADDLPDIYTVTVDSAPEGGDINRVLGAGLDWEGEILQVASGVQLAWVTGDRWVVLYEIGGTLYSAITSDNGDTWTGPTAISLATTETAPDPLSILALPNGTVIALVETYAAGDAQVIRSTDYGASWGTVFARPSSGAPSDTGVVAMSYAGQGRVWLNAEVGSGPRYSWISDDNGATWYRNPYPLAGSADNVNAIFFGTSFGIGTRHATDKIYTTTDGGETWTERENLGSTFDGIQAAAADGDSIAMVDDDEDLWYSADAGVTWGAKKQPAVALGVLALGNGRWLWPDAVTKTIRISNDNLDSVLDIATPFGINAFPPGITGFTAINDSGIILTVYQSTADSNWYVARSVPTGTAS